MAQTVMDIVRDNAAQESEDAASHGYNGRDGHGAQLLKECARAVRIAARSVESAHNVPSVSADERADYTSEIVGRLVGENGGKVPEPGTHALSYLVKRARGVIMNDRSRYGLDLTQPADAEAGADARLDGPLSIPPEIEAACARLDLTETARRALIAGLVPATREEWADFYGYSGPESFHVIAKRGRRELRMIGPDAIRQAIRDAEQEAEDILDEIERDLAAFFEVMSNV